MPSRPRALYLSDELIAELDRRAAADGRSRSAWLQRYLEGCLLAHEHQGGTQAPIPPRQPRCATCSHLAELHDAAGCAAGIPIASPKGGSVIDGCPCEGYRPTEGGT